MIGAILSVPGMGNVMSLLGIIGGIVFLLALLTLGLLILADLLAPPEQRGVQR